jgi:acetoacetate decarboxylase
MTLGDWLARQGGFSAPLDPSGEAALYGPPPWRFRGRSMTVVVQCDPQAVAALTPPPLTPIPGAPVRFTVHDLVCDIGLGPDFAACNPERTQVREAVVAIAATHQGRAGFYDPFLWCDSDAEIAVGREMFGWPQKAADIWMTPPDPIHGLRQGDRLTAKVARLGRPVFEIAIDLDGPGDLPGSVPAFTTFYTMRVLPDPAGGPTTAQVYTSDMEEIAVHAPFAGQGLLSVHAPELAALRPAATGPARANAIAWTKAGSTLIS